MLSLSFRSPLHNPVLPLLSPTLTTCCSNYMTGNRLCVINVNVLELVSKKFAPVYSICLFVCLIICSSVCVTLLSL